MERLRECHQLQPLSLLWVAIIDNTLATFQQCFKEIEKIVTFCEACRRVHPRQTLSFRSRCRMAFPYLLELVVMWPMLDSEVAAQSKKDRHVRLVFWWVFLADVSEAFYFPPVGGKFAQRPGTGPCGTLDLKDLPCLVNAYQNNRGEAKENKHYQ